MCVKPLQTGNSTQVIFCRVVLLISVRLLSAKRPLSPSKWVFVSPHSLTHSSQCFRYSAVCPSLNLAWHSGHWSSDWPEHSVQAGLGVAAAAVAAAAGCCCVSATVLSRCSASSFCRLEEILCPMCTRHMGTSLLSLLAPCWQNRKTNRMLEGLHLPPLTL